MATYTARLGLYKPAADGSENVNVVSDLNDNWDRVDALVSFVPVTTGTYPASGYRGQGFYETDTGKGYINTSAVASTITKAQVLVAGADFDSGITIPSSANQIKLGGSDSSAKITVRGISTSTDIFSGQVTGASATYFFIRADGRLAWGGGSSSTDTNLYRDSANVLKTDDSLLVGGSLTVTASANLDDAVIGGNLVVGTAFIRPQLHVATTVSNTTTETALQTLTIPADDAVAGAVYRIRAYGTLAVTGTPTMTFRFRIGGAAGTQLVAFPSVTVRSNATDGYWDIDAIVTCVTTGASGTWAPMMKYSHNFVGTATTYAHVGPITGSPVTRDTTASNGLVITAQWSAASSSNSIVCRGSLTERIA